MLDDALRGVTDRWLIVGASARDLILHHAYQIPISRFTNDLDIAVAVPTWAAFRVLEQTLLANGATQVKSIAHRFFLSGWAIDVIPFEGVEEDGVITWPDGFAMPIVGFSEASADALRILLPHNITVDIASLPAQLILKITAWEDRHYNLPHHDAHDIRTLIESYARPWNEERLYGEAGDLLATFGYDNNLAAAALMGRDAAAIAEPDTRRRIAAVLEREAAGESLLLASDMNGRAEDNLNLLKALLFGFSI